MVTETAHSAVTETVHIEIVHTVKTTVERTETAQRAVTTRTQQHEELGADAKKKRAKSSLFLLTLYFPIQMN